MKKIFTLALLAAAALSAAAQTVSFASGYSNTNANKDAIIADNNLKLTGGTWSVAKDSLLAVDAAADTEVILSWGDNVEISYTNTSGKAGIIMLKKDYVELGGKNVILTVYSEGKPVQLTVSAKSSSSGKEAIYSILDESATTSDGLTVATYVSKEEEASVLNFAVSGQALVLKETNNGYRLFKAVIGDGTGVESVAASKKAQKVIENGQIVIIRNGVRYNLLGAKL